jgi:hypothetical protein
LFWEKLDIEIEKRWLPNLNIIEKISDINSLFN